MLFMQDSTTTHIKQISSPIINSHSSTTLSTSGTLPDKVFPISPMSSPSKISYSYTPLQSAEDKKPKLFCSRRRRELLIKDGKYRFEKRTTKRERSFGLIYDIPIMRENYKDGSEKGRPSDWKPSKLSENLPPKVAEPILRQIDPEYLKKLQIVKRTKEFPIVYKNELEHHRKVTVNQVCKDAPLVGYSVAWDEKLDKFTNSIPKRTNATESIILRSAPVNHKAKPGLDYHKFVDSKAESAIQVSREVNLLKDIGMER
jgi:hypothetical protein